MNKFRDKNITPSAMDVGHAASNNVVAAACHAVCNMDSYIKNRCTLCRLFQTIRFELFAKT